MTWRNRPYTADPAGTVEPLGGLGVADVPLLTTVPQAGGPAQEFLPTI